MQKSHSANLQCRAKVRLVAEEANEAWKAIDQRRKKRNIRIHIWHKGETKFIKIQTCSQWISCITQYHRVSMMYHTSASLISINSASSYSSTSFISPYLSFSMWCFFRHPCHLQNTALSIEIKLRLSFIRKPCPLEQQQESGNFQGKLSFPISTHRYRAPNWELQNFSNKDLYETKDTTLPAGISNLQPIQKINVEHTKAHFESVV